LIGGDVKRANQVVAVVDRLESEANLRRDPRNPRHWKYQIANPRSPTQPEYIAIEALEDLNAPKPSWWAVVEISYAVSYDDMRVTMLAIELVRI
jgi:hypothetical protein